MPSWQARCLSAAVRAVVRRRDWGREQRLARRARRVFGVPAPVRALVVREVAIEPIATDTLRGEWLRPRSAAAAAQHTPVIMYIHGGGYVACSAATHRPITAALARLSGYPVCSINYRLAPEHRYPAALDDAVAAYRTLLDQNIPPSSIALAGDSAGGGLVLGVLLRARASGLPLPACAAGLSPWTDLVGTGASAQGNNGKCAMFRPENLEAFATAYLAGASPRDPLVSPVFAEMNGLPPLLFQVGSTELLLDDARRVHERVVQAGGRSRLTVYDDVPHCWQMLAGVVPEADAALQEIATFVREHLH